MLDSKRVTILVLEKDENRAVLKKGNGRIENKEGMYTLSPVKTKKSGGKTEAPSDSCLLSRYEGA